MAKHADSKTSNEILARPSDGGSHAVFSIYDNMGEHDYASASPSAHACQVSQQVKLSQLETESLSAGLLQTSQTLHASLYVYLHDSRAEHAAGYYDQRITSLLYKIN